MDKVKKYTKIGICIAVIMMVLSAVVVSFIQTDGGKVTMKELKIETDAGYAMSCYLYIPDTATAESPAPAVVTSHGAYNNKEMQDINSVELSRRGYVVLAVDQPGHGDTDLIDGRDAVYQGVLALSRLPYVDVERIGVTGHSMGGMSCNWAVFSDNENETNLISAVVLNSADAIYVNAENAALTDSSTEEYANIYGSRDIAIISCVYDEFFHKSTDENGNTLSSPYFMDSPNAQSFLNFGQNPVGLEKREAFTIYHEMIDGEDSARAIYRPSIIHPWSHFSKRSASYTIEFFDEALDAPNSLASTNQVWMFKEAFNLVGLIGFVLFIMNLSILMLFTPFFGELRSNEIALPMTVNTKGKMWFWLSAAAATLFSILIYVPVLTRATQASVKASSPFGVGCWALVCGLFSIASMILCYYTYGRKNGIDLMERGIKMPVKKLGKTILLALIVVCISYSCVFLAHYFFLADFRIWTLGVKAFAADKVAVILLYLPLFMIFYVAASVSSNCFNYNTIGGKGIGNNFVVSLLTAAPALIMSAMQYGTYFTTGHMFWTQQSFSGGNPPMYVLWLIQVTVILFGTTFISRFIYKVTKNPYIAGIMNALLVTIISLTNTKIVL